MTLFHLHCSFSGGIDTRVDLSTDEINWPMCNEIKIGTELNLGLTEERSSQNRFITVEE
jgi:hypothetical protein